MARNRYAGKTYGKSKTAQYYKKNKAARNKKRKYDKEYDKQPWRRKAQAVLKAIRRKNGTEGNGDMMDEAHVSGSKTKKQHYSKNRDSSDKSKHYQKKRLKRKSKRAARSRKRKD
jgi:hypothetical protein